jgi:transcriptional regulator with XRE-family HTH domain
MRLRRERLKVSASDLGRALGWSASKMSRVELGMYRISEVEVTHYLATCRVSEQDLFDLLDLKRDEERNLGFWMRPHETGRLSNSLRSLVYHESTAIKSTCYEPEVVRLSNFLCKQGDFVSFL